MLDTFMATYRKKLIEAREKYPEVYDWAPNELDARCARLRRGIIDGTYLRSGHALRATCKALGIRCTYAAINVYCECPKTPREKTQVALRIASAGNE